MTCLWLLLKIPWGRGEWNKQSTLRACSCSSATATPAAGVDYCRFSPAAGRWSAVPAASPGSLGNSWSGGRPWEQLIGHCCSSSPRAWQLLQSCPEEVMENHGICNQIVALPMVHHWTSLPFCTRGIIVSIHRAVPRLKWLMYFKYLEILKWKVCSKYILLLPSISVSGHNNVYQQWDTLLSSIKPDFCIPYWGNIANLQESLD